MAANAPYQMYQNHPATPSPQHAHSATHPPQSAHSATPPPVPVENIQPTVRMIRLYKPGFHITSTLPLHPGRNAIPRGADGRISEAAEFTLSSHLILPDSFGDIYLGEKFCSFVSIVNGFPNVPFYNVGFTVQLQTGTRTVDLEDSRPSKQPMSNSLGYNESSDIIVSHSLNELGTHTLRISVQYSLAYNAEVKTLRKMYRFNVLNPLLVQSSFLEVNQLPMIQCQVTNSTKSPIYIEEMNFSPRKNLSVTPLHSARKVEDTSVDLLSSDIVLLHPEESFAFAFQCHFYDGLVDRSLGHPVITWCNSMGDSAVFRGEDTVIKNSLVPSLHLPQPVKGLLLSAPGVVFVDEAFEVAIRLVNTSSMHLSLTLTCRNHLFTINTSSTTSRGAEERASLTAPAVSFVPTVDERHRGLVFTGLTSHDLGILDSEASTDIHVNLYAASGGLFDLPVITVINNQSKERYTIGGLAKVLVKERDQAEEDEDDDDDVEEQEEEEEEKGEKKEPPRGNNSNAVGEKEVEQEDEEEGRTEEGKEGNLSPSPVLDAV